MARKEPVTETGSQTNKVGARKILEETFRPGNEDIDPLMAVITAQEAAQLWLLSRNAVSDACRLGALRGRKSGQTWLVTVADMLRYQNGRYWPDRVPPELKPAFEQAIAQMKEDN